MSNKSHFTNIRHEILTLLNGAEKEVLIAMAWFTSQELLDAIIQCLRRGVKVKLVLLDDIINHCDFGVDFNLFIKEEGSEFYLYPQLVKFMHNKFCIIDGKTLITGSYNWTNYAETRNLENIIVSTEPSVIEEYTDCFYCLIQGLEQTRSFSIVACAQIPENEFYTRLTDIAQEIFSTPKSVATHHRTTFTQKVSSAKIEIPESVKSFMKKDEKVSGKPGYTVSVATPASATNIDAGPKPITTNISKGETTTDATLGAISNKVVITEVKNFKYAVSKYNIGFKANLIEQNGKVGLKVMIAKGTALPCTVTTDAKSANTGEEENMTSSCEFYYGGSIDLSECTKFGDTLTLDKLPMMKEGEVKFKILMTLEESGKLSIKFVCTNTGTGVEGQHTSNSFVEYHNS